MDRGEESLADASTRLGYPPRMRPEITPVGIGQAGPGQLRIDWKDGHRSLYPVRLLRLACRCAHCIGEPSYPITRQ